MFKSAGSVGQFCAIKPQPSLFRCGQVAQTRLSSGYVHPGSRSVLEKRLPRRLKKGQIRPPIYYKFDCVVELSDGSTVTRRSQFPKTEWRYLADSRSNPKWNPTRKSVSSGETDAAGRMAKFRQRFAFFDSDSPEPSSSTPAKEQAKEAAGTKTDQAAAEPADELDDLAELMGQNVVPVQSGGKVAAKRRGGRK